MTDAPGPLAKQPFNPWPWVAPVVLLIVALANVVLIHLALSTDDGLVCEDWYERAIDWDGEHVGECGGLPAAAPDAPATP